MQTLKKIPILVITFWLALGWIVIPSWMVYRLIMFLIGYWKCDECEKWKWVKDEKHSHRQLPIQYSVYMTICDGCHKKLLEQQEQFRKNRPLPPPPRAKK